MSEKELGARLVNASKKQRRWIRQGLTEARDGDSRVMLASTHGEDWVIPFDELEFIKELGSGIVGSVFKGLYKGQKVAIKPSKDFREEFKALRSPNIATFYGACLEPRLCVVMEYCSRGSLYSVLRDTSIQLGWQRILDFAEDIAATLNFLHSSTPPIFHQEVKSMSLLVWIPEGFR